MRIETERTLRLIHSSGELFFETIEAALAAMSDRPGARLFFVQ